MNIMKMKFSLVIFLLWVSTLSNVVHAFEHDSSRIDQGAHTTSFPQSLQQKLLERQKSTPSIRSFPAIPMADTNPPFVDVAVVMHSSWVNDDMKPLFTLDLNGRFYENGAQFAIARIKAQFDAFNEVLAKQNVHVRIRPAFFGVVSPELVDQTDTSVKYNDFDQVLACIHYPETDPVYVELSNVCSADYFKSVREAVFGKVDIIYYVRSGSFGNLGEYNQGNTPAFIGAAVYDGFADEIRSYRSSRPGRNSPPPVVETYEFSDHHFYLFMHEMGHVFDAQHEVTPEEPTANAIGANRAYGCGKAEGLRYVPGDIDTMKKTIMWNGYGSSTKHMFFSDPDLVVDGDRCGVPGVADNISTIRKNTWIATIHDLPTPRSEVSFVETTKSVRRDTGQATLLLRRTGDLTDPAYLTITAKDGTAWELRDFSFGLQEIKFAAGESEKEVNVTLLPRARGHLDTSFSLVVHSSIGATVNTVEPEVTILSDKPMQYGVLQFETSIEVVEGSTAKLTLVRTEGVDGAIEFKVDVKNGTAINGSDFNATQTFTGVLKDGESSKTFEIPTVKRAGGQGERAFSLTLREVSGGAVVGVASSATVKIQDEPELGVLDFSAASITLNETTNAILRINRSNGTDKNVGVRIRTIDGTAFYGVDYIGFERDIEFPAGKASMDIEIQIVNRPGEQGPRYFDVSLSHEYYGVKLGNITSTRVNIVDVVPKVELNPKSEKKSAGSFGFMGLLTLLTLFVYRTFKAYRYS